MVNNNYIFKSFSVFNPTLCESEKEEKNKILFYYPTHIDTESQLKAIGLCEALIKFSSSFNSKNSCELFCTLKTKQYYHQVEPNYWMVLTIETPKSTDDIDDNIFKSALLFLYKTFHLLHGTMTAIDSLDLLKSYLQNFFLKHFDVYKIEESSLLNIFFGIHFLPLSKEPFLHIIKFLNNVELKFPMIKQPIFLYNEQLVWSSVPPDEMQVLYHYLLRIIPNTSSVSGCFITETGNMNSNYSSKVPTVHLKGDSSLKCFQLIIYNMLGATLCGFVEDTFKSEDFLALHSYLEPRLPKLISEVSEFIVRLTPSQLDPIPRFLYFNNVNKAIKSTLNEKGDKPVTDEAYQLITGINNLCCDNGEIIMKTMSATWIAGKRSSGRQFYIVHQKKSSLVEIGAEIKKICDSQLKGIFFLE